MKIVILESQNKRLIESEKEQKVLVLPGSDFFGENPQEAWDNMQKLLKLKGYPPYSVRGDLNLRNAKIQSLGNLESVGGDLNLHGTPIKSLGKLKSVGGFLDLGATGIKSLGNLQSVGDDLYLQYSVMESLGNLESVGDDLFLHYSSIESLGNLKYVGGDLDFSNTPLSEMYTEKQIREIVNINGEIFFVLE